jgi:hypothetical protein
VGDQADYGAAMRDERRARHLAWHEENMAVLRSTGLSFTEQATVVLFREVGKPRVDFYPHTGRWRRVGNRVPAHAMSGGARAFLSWYARTSARSTR